MAYTLKRRYFDEFTFSTLHRADDSQVCYFVERQWLDNEPMVSCIPEGDYTLSPTVSPKFGPCYFVEGGTVTLSGPSKRTHILIHKANRADELHGCLACGIGLGVVGGRWAVVNSGHAFDALMEEFDGEEIKLKIEGHKL